MRDAVISDSAVFEKTYVLAEDLKAALQWRQRLSKDEVSKPGPVYILLHASVLRGLAVPQRRH